MLELARDPATLELRREPVSAWSIAEHCQHLTLADTGILDHLEEAEPPPELAGKGPTLMGRFLLFTGTIPRGRAKAPSFVSPRDLELDKIEPALAATRERFAALDLERLPPGRPLARHFAFGHLDGAQWLRFVGLHHHHHWKIIRDIRRAA